MNAWKVSRALGVAFVVAASVGVGGFLIRVWCKAGADSEQTKAGLAHERAKPLELERVESQLAAVQSQVFTLRHELATRQSPGDVPVKVGSADNAEVTVEDQRIQAAKAWKEHMAAVAESFAEEPWDSSWAENHKEVLGSLITADPVLRMADAQIDCRSRTCRVDLSGTGAVNKQLAMFAQTAGKILANIQADRVDDGNGNVRMLLYMTNESVVADSNDSHLSH